ncbi:MAG: response regulator [Deltaproteobacteria bacterium]|nr:response regulator [Deltaproteobacteria bacterium]
MRNEIIKVLLVEDNPGDARFIKELLSDAGRSTFEIEVVERLSSALKILAEKRFDVVLLDLSLPDSSGLETLVKTFDGASRIAIIVLTGLDDEMIAVKAVRKGAQDYLVKGQINTELLSRTICYSIERKQSEETLRENEKALRESEKKYRTLLEITSEGWWMLSPELKIIEVNESFCNMLGYSQDEMIDKTPVNFVDDENRKIFIEQTSKIFTTSHRSYEISLKKKNGQDLHTYFNATTIWDESGEVQGSFALITDITERKRVEEALRESEEKYRSMMEAMDDAAYICSHDFRVEYMNPAMITRIGHGAIGKPCYEVIHGLDGKCPWCVTEEVMQGEHIKIEIASPKDDNSYNVSCSPIFHADGSISQLAIFRNITESKEMEQQLQQAQKMESLGTLAGGIAHDFNNVLSPMMGYAEIILDDLPEDSPHRKNITTILQGAKRARDLVKQILTFSRQVDQKLKPTKVQLIIKEVLKLIRSSLPSTIEIKQNVSNKCGLVMADFTQIHQIAMNLMTNAYQAMEAEGGELEVTLKEVELGVDDLTDSSMTPGAYVCLIVADTGPGMDQSAISHIFEPYFTTKESGKGTGLGLAVVYGIVKSYQGEIRIYSGPGKGSAFHIYLPIIKTQVETEKTKAVTPVQKGTEQILLVDDEEPIVSMESEMLERLGYQVVARTSSPDALEAFRASPDKFDLVITDMTMPNLTGVQLSQKLLEIKSDIPIIICTGFSTKVDGEKAKAAGIRGYVMKPVVKSELAEKIREVLDEK